MPDALKAAVALLVSLCLAPLLIAVVSRRRVSLLSAPALVSLMVLLGYVGPLSGILAETDLFFTRFPGYTADLTGAVTRALVVASLGMAGFYLGYFFLARLTTTPSKSRSEPMIWNPRALRRMGALYTVVGIALFGVAVALLGGPSALLTGLGDRIRLTAGLHYFFQAINLVIVVALAWWMYLLSTGRRLWAPGFLVYLTAAVVLASLQGSKSILFIFAVALVSSYDAMRRRVSNAIVIAGAIGGFALLTGYALFTREYLSVGEFVTVEAIDSETARLVLEREFFGNFIQLQTLTVLVDRVPQDLDYQWGKTYLSLLTLPVPRALWPEKPLPSTGVFTLAFWPDSWLESGTTLPPGLMGEMYMNFGLFGVPLGMMAFGWILGRLRRSIHLDPGNPAAQGTHALAISLIPHFLRGDFGANVILLILLLPLLFLLRVVTRRGVQIH